MDRHTIDEVPGELVEDIEDIKKFLAQINRKLER